LANPSDAQGLEIPRKFKGGVEKFVRSATYLSRVNPIRRNNWKRLGVTKVER